MLGNIGIFAISGRMLGINTNDHHSLYFEIVYEMQADEMWIAQSASIAEGIRPPTPACRPPCTAQPSPYSSFITLSTWLS